MKFKFLALALLLAGCGSSPTSPSPTPIPQPAPPPASSDISGSWSGTLTLTILGQRGSTQTATELTVSGRSVSGAWRVTSPATNDSLGTIIGTIDGSGANTRFAGTVTLDSPSAVAGTRCLARGIFAGTAAGASPMVWESEQFTSETCANPPTGIVWAMSR